MPSTSAKQAKFMRAVAHSPKFAKKVGVKQAVGKDFEMADKKTGPNGLNIPKGGYNDPYEKTPPKPKPEPTKPLGPAGKKGYAKGGNVMKKSDKAGRALVKKSADTMGRAMAGGGKCYAKGGSVSARADGCATKGKTKGKMV